MEDITNQSQRSFLLSSSLSLNNHFQHSASYNYQQSNKTEASNKMYLPIWEKEDQNIYHNGLHIVGTP